VLATRPRLLPFRGLAHSPPHASRTLARPFACMLLKRRHDVDDFARCLALSRNLDLRRSLLDLAAMRSEDVEESCCSLRLFGDAAQLATPVLDHFGYRVGKTFTINRLC
jgi:hypothetical protein